MPATALARILAQAHALFKLMDADVVLPIHAPESSTAFQQQHRTTAV
jgi:hypothetical protein